MGLYTDEFNVMVVEDDHTQRKLINKVLSKIEGVQTVLCVDAFEAYSVLISKDKIDMVMLDVNLPHTQGTSLVTKLRSMTRYENLPILLSTAESSLEGTVAAQATGILTKPYDVRQIRIFIDAFRSVEQ